MGSLALLRPLLGGRVVRLFLAVSAGVGLATSLGLAYPVQRELDAAAYGRAAFASEAQLVVGGADAARLAALSPRPNCLAVRWVTSLAFGTRVAGPADLIGVAPDCDQTVTTWPESTRFAFRAVAGDRWLDLTADAAHELGVGPGDQVRVFVGEGRQPLFLTVRGIYATRPAGPFGGRTSAAALVTGDQSAPVYSTLFSAATAETLAADLGRAEVAALLDPKAPPIVSSREALADAAQERSSASLGLVRVIAVLAVAGGLAFALRETDVFRRSLLQVLRPVHELGGDAPGLLRAWRAAAIVTTAAAAALGVAAGTLPSWLGLLAPTFPVSLVGVLLGALGAGTAVFVLVSVMLYARSAREFG